ncbi:MAG: hypothetical protein ACOYB2_10820 [Limnohabitans sp.]
MRPVLVPQYPNKRVGIGNSIVQVGRSVAAGLDAHGGRLIAPPPTANRIDGSMYGPVKRVDAILAPTGSDRIVTTKPIMVEEDEYLLSLTPTVSWDLMRSAKVAGSMFGKPKLVNYALYGPDEDGGWETRLHLAAFAEFPVLWNSAFTRDNWLRTARTYLSASEVMRIQKHSAVANIGIECAAIDAAGAGVERDPATLSYHSRVTAEKGFPRVLEVATRTLPLVDDGRLRVSTYGQSSEDSLREAVAGKPWIEPHYGEGRAAYFRMLWQSTAFISFSQKESVGLSWLEQLYAGQVGLFWERPWVRAIFGWYPMVTSDTREIESAVPAMLRDVEAWRAKLPDVRSIVQTDWDASGVPERVAAGVEAIL